jgi:hypothetical protein
LADESGFDRPSGPLARHGSTGARRHDPWAQSPALPRETGRDQSVEGWGVGGDFRSEIGGDSGRPSCGTAADIGYYPGTEDPHTSPKRKQGFLACASG